jgi:endonuclease YncB( thermonuclease family)
VSAAEFSAKVIAVMDGDTVLIKRDSGVLKIRLTDIDAPEKAQPFGETSKRSLSDMVLGKIVNINSQAMDKYGRMVARLEVNGLNVNAEMIRLGMAWEYSRFYNNKKLLALQAEAQQAPRGLWALTDPMPPWEWRKLHPRTDSKSKQRKVVSSKKVKVSPVDASCGAKKRCREMSSCEEAKHYFTQCGLKKLDGDSDGIPCEILCQPKK